MSRTIEQRRAAFALSFINYQLSNNTSKKEDKEKLSTHIHKSPSLILQCGLGQALAFLLADAADKPTPSKLLYDTLQDWLCGAPDKAYPMRVYSQAKLMDMLVNGTRDEYFRAQEESLMLLNWLKKFAAAKL